MNGKFVINFGKFQESKFLKFLGFMWNPLSWVMEAAAVMAIALANGGVRTYFLDSFLNISYILRTSDPLFYFGRVSLQIGRTLWVSSLYL